ncbi:hypothetical protein [Azospirillum himalayense]|uniref:Glycosyltransferase involved in cell wall biosynthesis n=1 Tax=Azospirillum himalayense TaxID=654847 RepID=A0ABW0G0G2_9PROT
MKKAPDLLDLLVWPVDVVQELLWFVCSVILALVARWKPKPIDVGLGPEPLINNIYHRKALIQAGFTAETFVSRTYFITQNFDHIIPAGDGALGKFIGRLRLFWHAVSRYKIIYIYFNGGPFFYTSFVWCAEPMLLRLARVRVVVMPFGGDVQDFTRSRNLLFKHAMTIDYPGHALRRKRVADQIDLWTRNADHILSGCEWVDYMYHWDTLQIAHFSIDTEALAARAAMAGDGQPVPPAEGRPTPERPLRVLHAPNHRAIKGTGAFLRAVEELAAEGVPIELEMVEFVTNDEVLQAILRSDVVLDQLIVGWYAMFAIEAMAMGKPVLCFLRSDLMELYIGAGLVEEGEIPIVNAHLLSVKEALRSLAATDRAELAALGRRSQDYVRRRHSLTAIGSVFARINSELGVHPT